MTEATRDPDDADDAESRALVRLIDRTEKGKQPSRLQLGDILDEFDAWLNDDRQWRRAQPQHWRTLIDDVEDRLRFVTSMSSPPQQGILDAHAEELKRLRAKFPSQKGEIADDALRRQLQGLSSGVRLEAQRSDVLVSGWRRIRTWTHGDLERADEALAALRDLAELQGHDADSLLDRMAWILRDRASYISTADGGPAPSDRHAKAGASGERRLALAEAQLLSPAHVVGGAIWLEYLQADLHQPPTLSLGSAVTLYQDKFLRAMAHQKPSDERIPFELRDEDTREMLLSCLHAYDPAEAVRADYELPGD